MEKEAKSLRLTLDYPTEDGKYTTKELTVKLSNPKLNKRYGNGLLGHFLTMEVLFSLEIPEFIHAELKGKSVRQKELGKLGGGEARKYEEDFPKSIKGGTLGGLTEAWVQIVVDYIWLKEMEKAELTKVIFYQFDNDSSTTKSTWNGLKLGHEASLKYSFAIGYISKDNGKSVYRYNADKKLVNDHYDREYYSFKYVKWTADREHFFNQLQAAFERQIEAMAEFEKNLSEEKINLFIADKKNLLALGGK